MATAVNHAEVSRHRLARSSRPRRLPIWPAAAAPRGVALALLVACGSTAEEPQGQRPAYRWLSETGVYSDLDTATLAPGVEPFTPAFKLWSDGSDKERFLSLPAGSRIDTSDMNHWSFPIGTRLWKQFSLAGTRLETRLIERYGPEPNDYWMGAFVWQVDQSDAEFVEQGQDDLLGTAHDAPAQDKCLACHNGEPGRVLGFSALQLAVGASPEDVTLQHLVNEQRLSVPPAADASYTPPGDPQAAAALGYLHANCGHCHNPRGTSWPDTQMLLRLDVEQTDVESSGVFQSTVGQELQYFRDDVLSLRIVPGQPERSGVLARMQVRGPKEQMPPLATEIVDAAGVELVRAWIASLPD